MKTANIFNIQHFSIHDGPGTRTVIFFKGCNLHCLWCHNPESIHAQKEILLYADRCIGCGACVNSCPTGANRFAINTDTGESLHLIDKKLCGHCFTCCQECYADALVSVGEQTDTDRIFKEIERNRAYGDRSGGGVTFSGGECMLQPDALTELLKRCKEIGIHTAVDTAGNVPQSYFEQVIPYTDLFLYDLKAFSPEVHKKCTGVSNERILENFRFLAKKQCELLVRIPYVPGYNDGELPAIAEFLAAYPNVRAELLGYHSMGNSKYKALMEAEGITARTPSKAELAELKKQYGFL